MPTILESLLINNTAAAIFIDKDKILKYVDNVFSGATRSTLKTFITSRPILSKVRVRINAGVAAQPTLNAFFALPGVQVMNANVPGLGYPAGTDHYDTLRMALARILMEEALGAYFVGPQPQRSAGTKEDKNMSQDFLMKHAQPTVPKAGAIALKRFQSTGLFAGQPAPPINQNFRSSSYSLFRTTINECMRIDLFETVEAYILSLKDELLANGQWVSTIQYVSAATYDVHTFTYNPATATLVNDSPVPAPQFVQYAFTRDIQNKKLIVNHFITPGGAGAPNPAGGWVDIPFADMIARKASLAGLAAGLRPTIHYLPESLNAHPGL